MKDLIAEVFEPNFRVYGARKAWLEQNRQGHVVARYTVERLMCVLGIAGIVRDNKVIATILDDSAEQGPGPGGP
ncbi:IS3 family transposase [Streptomyces sp. NPDC085614]|uniref:IS3 family transposase n=1 Tax=Streptomyces sp. NPDC085614 TaxID=3365733 RepID=UPI0037D550F8